MAQNKKTTEANGHLALLNPRPEVVQILQKAGIFNALRVFKSEDEISQASEEIIAQSANSANTQPMSEFDDLRSEIGSVFGNTPPVQPQSNEYPDSNQKDNSFGYGQDFNFANKVDTPVSPNLPKQPSQQQVPPRGPFARPGFPAQPPQFQSRQFTPPPVTPSRPIMPPPVQPRGMDSIPKPPTRKYPGEALRSEQSDFPPETQKFQPISSSQTPKQPKIQESQVPVSFDEELEGIGAPKGSFQKLGSDERNDVFDVEEDISSSGAKKKSPVLAFSLVAILLIAVIAGVLFGYMSFLKKPQDVASTEATTPKAPETTTSQPVATPPATAPVAQTPTSANLNEPTKKVSSVTESKKVSAEKQKSNEKKYNEKVAKSEKATKKSEMPVADQTPVAPPPKAVATVNKVIITSSPSGALVSVNGENIGKTPVTWNKPVFGPLSIELSKAGFKSASKDLEFTGGLLKEEFTLDKETPPPPAPKPEPKVVKQEPKPEPAVAQQPKPVEAPVATQPVKEPVSAPVSTPAPAASNVSAGGGDASIFIASIPPVADVYLNGKLVGRTNVSELKLQSGTVTLRFVKGPKETTQEITLQPGKNPSRLIRLP